MRAASNKLTSYMLYPEFGAIIGGYFPTAFLSVLGIPFFFFLLAVRSPFAHCVCVKSGRDLR